jgi:hypothetical protein
LALDVISLAVFATPIKLPVKLVPLKVFAVTMPDTLIFDGSLAVSKVPDEILLAFIVLIADPDPEKEDAVMIPVAKIFPVLLMPTPFANPAIVVLAFPPT